MSDLPKRLRASVGFDAINGDAFERTVCAKQMLEAADEIEGLQGKKEQCLEYIDQMLRMKHRELGEQIEQMQAKQAAIKTEMAALKHLMGGAP